MRFSDVFTARALAFRLTEDPTNATPYLGQGLYPGYGYGGYGNGFGGGIVF